MRSKYNSKICNSNSYHNRRKRALFAILARPAVGIVTAARASVRDLAGGRNARLERVGLQLAMFS
jgi:hypothetical protein